MQGRQKAPGNLMLKHSHITPNKTHPFLTADFSYFARFASGNEKTNRVVEFRHSTRNASIRWRMGYGGILMFKKVFFRYLYIDIFCTMCFFAGFSNTTKKWVAVHLKRCTMVSTRKPVSPSPGANYW